MDEPQLLAPPVQPADMGDVKSICSLLQEGRLTWNELVALDSSASVKAPDWTNSPAEELLKQELRATLAGMFATKDNTEEFERVTNTLLTHLFYRSLTNPSPAFRTLVDGLKAKQPQEHASA
jgi:hypothetical protein